MYICMYIYINIYTCIHLSIYLCIDVDAGPREETQGADSGPAQESRCSKAVESTEGVSEVWIFA